MFTQAQAKRVYKTGRMAFRTSAQRIAARTGLPPIVVLGRHKSLFEDLYHFVIELTWPRFFLLQGGVFLLLNVAFAGCFWVVPGSVEHARAYSFEDAFFFSVQTLATIGYGGMAPATRYAHVVVTAESFVGLLFSALTTGITFAKFSRPRARILFAEKCVVGAWNGVPHLMFRMANWRQNLVLETTVRVVLLVSETTLEGETIRRQVEVPLVRDRSALFALSFLAMHRIDEHSPFFGQDRIEQLRAGEADLLVSLSGTDETVAQTIHGRHRYRLDDIVWNARFAEVISRQNDGTRVLDYRKFHDVISSG